MTIKIDTKGLDGLLDKVNNLSPKIDEAVYSAMADQGGDWWSDVKGNTPRDTGDLQKSWTLTGPDKKGNKFEMDLNNNLEYALYVELGHRTRGGKSSVKGRYMLRDGTRRLEETLKPAVKKEVRKAIESL